MNIEYEDGTYKFKVNGNSIECSETELEKDIKECGIKDFSIIIYSTAKTEIERIQKIATNIRLEIKVN